MSQNLSLPQLDELLRDLEANDLLHIRGFTENKDFKMRWSEFLEGISDSFGDSFVKFTINNQGLDATQRQNARTNIQALAKDVADTHLGTLTNNGQLIINAAQALVANTGTNGSASNNVVNISNNLGGGMKMSGRGGVKFRSRGDSTTDYSIAEFQNNSSVETTVFGILGTNGYTQVGIPASPSSAVLFDVFGKVRHVDATEADESATLGQVQALVAGAGTEYDAYLEFNEVTDLWQVGFADDFLQFFEGVFSFNYTGGLSLEIGNDAVNDWFEFVSSAGILGYNFDKPVRVNGAELLDGAAVESVITEKVPNPDNDQFGLITNTFILGTIFKRPKDSRIDFRTSGHRLDDTKPVYDDFTIPEDYLLKSNLLNKWDILFSCATVPAIISSPPSWLTVTGTILTGYANLNRITFQLDQVYNITTDLFELKVICNITQAEGANKDPVLKLLVNSIFNDNRVLAATDTLVNDTMWTTAESEVQVQNGASIIFTDLGSGNYSIRTGLTGGGRVVCLFGTKPLSFLNNRPITIIARFRAGSSTSTRVICSNIDTANTRGFYFAHFSDNRLRLEIGEQISTERLTWATGVEPESEDWIEAALTIQNGIGRIFARIASLSVPFGLKASKDNFTHLNINSDLPLRLDQTTSASSSVNWTEKDYFLAYAGILSGSTIEKIMDQPQNALNHVKDFFHKEPVYYVKESGEAPSGFAGLYNNGRGVSGGREGKVLEYSDLNKLIQDFATSDQEEREIYRYTGENASLVSGFYDFKGLKNKTIEGFGQIINLGQLGFIDCENLIIRNLKRTGTGDDTQDIFTINSSIGVWMDHLDLDSLENFDSGTHVDGIIDIGFQSDLIEVSNSKIFGGHRGILIGYSDLDTGSSGKLRVTIRNCHWKNNYQRVPFVRGVCHLLNNLQEWDVNLVNVFGQAPAGSNLGVAAVNGGQIYSEENYFEKGYRVWRFEPGGSTDAGIVSVNDFRGDYVVSAELDTPYNPELVTFNPNTTLGYRYPSVRMTPAEARAFILQNAGTTLGHGLI